MNELLPTLAALTLGGSAAVCVLALVSRSARSRYGARWRCLAWLLLCLRLAVPFSVFFQVREAARSLIQLPAPADTIVYQYHPDTDSPGQGAGVPASPPPAGGTAALTPPAVPASAPAVPAAPEPEDSQGFTLTLSQILILAWLAGAAVMALWVLAAHIRFLRYLHRWARPSQDPDMIRMHNLLGDQLKLNHRPRLQICPGLRAPMLAGLFHTILLLPDREWDETALRCSLLHELTHYRRRDIWLKTLALWVNVVHWFNPLIWYMNRLVERDTELACDEAVLRRLPLEEHAAYGRAILDAVERLRGQDE